jgi:Dullard-like phosphatase family protein
MLTSDSKIFIDCMYCLQRMCDGGVCDYHNELYEDSIYDLKFTGGEFEQDEEDDDIEFITSLNNKSFNSSKINASIDIGYSKMTNNFESFKSAMAYFNNDNKRSNSIGLKKKKKNIEVKKKRLNVIKAGKNNNNINQNSDFPSFKKERGARKESVNSRDKTHCTNSSNKFENSINNSETYIADSISEIKNTLTDNKMLEIEKTESSRKRFFQTNNSKTRHKVITSRKKANNKTTNNLNNKEKDSKSLIINENDESFDNVSKKLEFDSISKIITENSNILQNVKEEKTIIPICNASINNSNKMKIPSSSFENITYDFYDSAHNRQNNYMEYVNKVLKSQINFNKLDFSEEIEKRKFALPPTDKKHTIILDLDETLVHSDFDYHYRNSNNDFIQTTEENAVNSNFNDVRKSQLEFHDTFFNDDETGEEIKIRFYVRPGLTQFLKNLSKNFQVGIFTAGIKEYAESVLKILDPKDEIFSFKCFRESCIKLGRAYVKDLRIFEEKRSLNNIVILDNNLYSFANQLSNGILINSFYQEAEDQELMNLEMYIHEYLAKCEDIKFVNEQVFKFENTLDNLRLFSKSK